MIQSRLVILLLIGIGLLLNTACAPEAQQDKETEKVVVRLPSDPDRLHPFLSTSGYAQQLQNHMFSAMMGYDPYTLEPEPVLAEKKPVVKPWVEAEDTLGLRIQYEIKAGATWGNGDPVTAEDYRFTLKSIFNPKVNAAQVRGYLDFVERLQIDDNNPKRFTVFADKNYFLAEPVASMISILPKDHYDPRGWLDTFSIETLRGDPSSLGGGGQAALDSFAEQFASTAFSREKAMGSGPYRLTDWTANQRLILERKEDWWGDEYRGENVFFEAYPDEIQYVIMPDEVGAISALKAGELDVVSEISPQRFRDLKKEASDRFEFLSPSVFQYYYVGLNNHDPLLKDRSVRRALVHTLNVEQIQSVVLDSLAQRIVSPIHPSKPYYNDTLEPKSYDVSKARDILEEAGWTDSDGDGIRDKMIDGERVSLSLTLNSTGSQVGKQISLIFQDGASKAGVDIEIENKEFRLILQAMRNRSYQMATLVGTQTPLPSDPYQNWHTDNDRPDGSNYYGFGDQKSDRIIDSLRKSMDPERRKHWYKRFQEMLYRRQPVLFMVSPRETIAIDDQWEVEASANSPGFFVPHFRKK